MNKRYICERCGLEFDRLSPDVVEGVLTRPACPGCGSENVSLTKECPVCGRTIPDYYYICADCEAKIRSCIVTIMEQMETKSRKKAWKAIEKTVRLMAIYASEEIVEGLGK